MIELKHRTKSGGRGKNRTWVLEEEPIRTLARAPRGLEEEDDPGTAQAAPPETSSRIAMASTSNTQNSSSRSGVLPSSLILICSYSAQKLLLIT